MKKPPKINDQQKAFVEAYIGPARFNAAAAAVMAGYSERSAREYGSRTLKKPQIRQLIDERLSEMSLSANEVLAELSDIARADWREFLEIRRDKNGDPIDATLRLTDKIKALELVGKHHKLFTDKVEHQNPDGSALAQPIADAMNSFEKSLLKIYGGDGEKD